MSSGLARFAPPTIPSPGLVIKFIHGCCRKLRCQGAMEKSCMVFFLEAALPTTITTMEDSTCQPVLCCSRGGLSKLLPFAFRIKDKTNVGISCRPWCTCFGPHAVSAHRASENLEPSSPPPQLTHSLGLGCMIVDASPRLPAVGKTACCKRSHSGPQVSLLLQHFSQLQFCA